MIIDIVENHIRMRPLSQSHCDFDNVKKLLCRDWIRIFYL